MAAEVDREQSQAALPSSSVRWNRFSSPCHNSTEDQLVSTQEGAAAQDQETSYQPDNNAHTSLHIPMHTLPYTQLTYMHSHNPPMHTHPYAYTSYHMHTHLFQTYRVTNSYMLCHASCSMLAITVILSDSIFLIFVPWS